MPSRLPSLSDLAVLPHDFFFRQWAHTFLSLKFGYYAVAMDGLDESAYAMLFCLVYSSCVLDLFKNVDGVGTLFPSSWTVCVCMFMSSLFPTKCAAAGIGTLTNSYFIYRSTRDLVMSMLRLRYVAWIFESTWHRSM
jgi:hypothetical protein